MLRLLPLLALALVGCRDAVVDPGLPTEAPISFSGRFVGEFEGEIGVLGRPGHVVKDTFRLALDVQQATREYFAFGRLRRGREPWSFYECDLQPVEISDDLRVRVDCLQASMLSSDRVLRLEADLDTAAHVLSGSITDVIGVRGARYPIELRKAPVEGLEPSR